MAQFNKVGNLHDQLIAYKEKDKSFKLTAFKNRFHNESLADLVKNTNAKERIVEYEGRLLQQTDPVYRDPEPGAKWDYRTHFLSPQKPFFGKLYDTYYFNVIVMWLITAFLYVTLYFEAFKKMFLVFGNVRSPKIMLGSWAALKTRLGGLRLKWELAAGRKKVATS